MIDQNGHGETHTSLKLPIILLENDHAPFHDDRHLI